MFKAMSLIVLLLMNTAGAQNMKNNHSDSLFFAQILPDSLMGWHMVPPDEIYTPNNLYQFIDGGAELYLSFGFQKLYHRTYVRPNHPDILVDWFDMKNSYNAFGVFMHTRETVDTTFGQGSEYVQGFLNFWKDRYYFSLLALAETNETKKFLFTLAHKIDQAIQQTGELPPLIKRLPKTGQNPASLRYFHHYIWLNSHLYLSNENIFQISKKDQIALAKYDDGSTLILIQYVTPQKAKQVWQELQNNHFPQLKQTPLLKLKNTYIRFTLSAPYLILIANHQQSNHFNTLLQETLSKIKKEASP